MLERGKRLPKNNGTHIIPSLVKFLVSFRLILVVLYLIFKSVLVLF